MIIDREAILVVDDSEINVDVLLSFLTEEYDVSVAIDGAGAIELVTRFTPSLILLDIVLPDIDGFEVCRRLKEDPRSADIPVIFITSLNRETDEAKGLDLGAVDYIVKPFSPALVKARIRNHLELERHRHKLERLVEERTRDLRTAQHAAVQCMAMMAETRDYDTGTHVQRTRNYVVLLARHLARHPVEGRRIKREDIETLAQAAPLHDVGKIGLPDSILLKPEGLTESEREEMKNHTTYGGEILRRAENELGPVPFLVMAREIAENHHERWDGSGYPRGLRGEEIPLSARIMAVADVYDALRSARPYKEPFSHEKAVRMISNDSGKHFDPVLVEAFLSLERAFERIAKRSS